MGNRKTKESATPEPPKKKRGRPRKLDSKPLHKKPEPPKKKRGPYRKKHPVDAALKNIDFVQQIKQAAESAAPEQSEQARTKAAKKAMIAAMKANLFNISESCRITGINRGTYYLWIENDPDFKSEIDLLSEEQKDFAESCLFTAMKQLDSQLIKFYLKTRCRDRGYIENSPSPPKENERKSDALLLQAIETMIKE